MTAFIAQTWCYPGSWGKGGTVAEAVRNLQAVSGARQYIKDYGYKVFAVHNNSVVDGAGYILSPQRATPPAEVLDRSKRRIK